MCLAFISSNTSITQNPKICKFGQHLELYLAVPHPSYESSFAHVPVCRTPEGVPQSRAPSYVRNQFYMKNTSAAMLAQATVSPLACSLSFVKGQFTMGAPRIALRHGDAIAHAATTADAVALMRALTEAPHSPAESHGLGSAHAAIQLAGELRLMMADRFRHDRAATFRDAIFQLRRRCSHADFTRVGKKLNQLIAGRNSTNLTNLRFLCTSMQVGEGSWLKSLNCSWTRMVTPAWMMRTLLAHGAPLTRPRLMNVKQT